MHIICVTAPKQADFAAILRAWLSKLRSKSAFMLPPMQQARITRRRAPCPSPRPPKPPAPSRAP
ncbi:hypothetical protein CNECB9_600011 [Cupriavidus necator]|uniref:Uncharacterized protein n=1 Tax=Cupriavidus necator TaxID=106590 RepID=A0A1K0J2Z4_CUPNE|nr:hypothetical protein CNECB9_600011 [Cupriavidus necator]